MDRRDKNNERRGRARELHQAVGRELHFQLRGSLVVACARHGTSGRSAFVPTPVTRQDLTVRGSSATMTADAGVELRIYSRPFPRCRRVPTRPGAHSGKLGFTRPGSLYDESVNTLYIYRDEHLFELVLSYTKTSDSSGLYCPFSGKFTSYFTLISFPWSKQEAPTKDVAKAAKGEEGCRLSHNFAYALAKACGGIAHGRAESSASMRSPGDFLTPPVFSSRCGVSRLAADDLMQD